MKHVIRTTAILVVLASLAMTADAASGQKHRAQRIRPTPRPTKVIAPPSNLGRMVGTWTLRNGDAPRTDIKMVFRPNGTFAFIGPNWKSAGKFHVDEHRLCLIWTSVDGSKVQEGTMKKDFPMADDDSSFTIDSYTYYKLPR